MKVNVIFARHTNSNKDYLFEVDSHQINPAYLRAGDYLFVDTCAGKTYATASTSVIAVNESDLSSLCKICGAYLPLRKCTERASQDFVNRIFGTKISEDDVLPY
jgi:hypothetical protein